MWAYSAPPRPNTVKQLFWSLLSPLLPISPSSLLGLSIKKTDKISIQLPKYHRQILCPTEKGLFVQKGAGVKPDFERAVREFYRSQVIDVDFGATGSGEVLKEING